MENINYVRDDTLFGDCMLPCTNEIYYNGKVYDDNLSFEELYGIKNLPSSPKKNAIAKAISYPKVEIPEKHHPL
tara:strand:+ start:8393 stop:8614 length:222 start_codon:yes stop_codon:yes gene_type:complete